MEEPSIANVVMRERVRYMDAEHQTNSVVRLKRIEQSWHVLIDEEIFQSQTSVRQARRMYERSPSKKLTVDLRPLALDQRRLAFITAVKKLMIDRFLKYEFVVGKNTDLSSELQQIATVFNVHHRIDFVEQSADRPGAL